MAPPLTLTTRGVVALAVTPVCALAGVLLGAEELVLLAIALVTLVLCGVVQSAYRARRARGSWRITAALPGGGDAAVAVGAAVDVSVTLATAGRGATMPAWLEGPQHSWIRIHRDLGQPPPRPRLPNPSLAWRVPYVESGGIEQFAFPVPTASRGVYALRGLRLWCFDSFGLVAQVVAVGPSATVTVHPVPVTVAVRDELLRGDAGNEDHEPLPVSGVAPKRANFGDFSGIRPYIPGDRLRLLYWPALARTGELMVRDFEDSRPQRVHVVADIRPRIGPEGCERVLAAAAGVGLAVLARGAVLELSTTLGERVAIGPGPLGDTALLRAIAAMETGARPSAAPSRPWRRRRAARPGRELHAMAGSPLVVTTAEGADDLPGSFGLLGFAHLVIAP